MSTPPMPGAGLLGTDRMVTTRDGRRLRTMVRGDGTDLVVLEAGLGLSGLYWDGVHDALASRVRVVAYERAGYGASDPAASSRTLSNLATDLEDVIAAFPHERLVLVGHSWGGPIIRTLAARLPADGSLAGIVLVDPSDENAGLYFAPMVGRHFSAQAATLAPLARLRLLGRLTRGTTKGLREPHRSAVTAASTSLVAARVTSAEQRYFISELANLRGSAPALGDLPIRVISGQVADPFGARIRQSLIEAHRQTVAQNPGATYVAAHRSAHTIPLSEPELIAAEALALFDYRAPR